MLNNPLNSPVQNLVIGPANPCPFLAAPFSTLAIITCGNLREQRRPASTRSSLCKQGTSGIGTPLPVRKRFEADTAYNYSIACLFSGINRLATGVGLEGMDGRIVHRFFAGGSDAVATRVEVDGRQLIREFITGAPARKLRAQAG